MDVAVGVRAKVFAILTLGIASSAWGLPDAGGHGDTQFGAACVNDYECDDGPFDCPKCIGNVCKNATCTASGGCGEGSSCKVVPGNPCANECVPTYCGKSADCASCMTCVEGTCQGLGLVVCKSKYDCAIGQTCQVDVEDPCKNQCLPEQSDAGSAPDVSVVADVGGPGQGDAAADRLAEAIGQDELDAIELDAVGADDPTRDEVAAHPDMATPTDADATADGTGADPVTTAGAPRPHANGCTSGPDAGTFSAFATVILAAAWTVRRRSSASQP